jgi:hypothetical protein
MCGTQHALRYGHGRVGPLGSGGRLEDKPARRKSRLVMQAMTKSHTTPLAIWRVGRHWCHRFELPGIPWCERLRPRSFNYLPAVSQAGPHTRSAAELK